MGSAPLKTGGSTFPTEMALQGNWRTYQARLLARLDFYIEDGRLHIEAAPGSGKPHPDWKRFEESTTQPSFWHLLPFGMDGSFRARSKIQFVVSNWDPFAFGNNNFQEQ